MATEIEKMNRTKELLADVAGQFERKCMVMNEEWMREEDVDLTEAEAVMDLAACVLRGFLKLKPGQQAALIMAGVQDES